MNRKKFIQDAVVKPVEINEIPINDLVFEVYSDINIGNIIEQDWDEKLDTDHLGEYTKEVMIGTDKYILNYKVVDTKAPIIQGGSTKTVTKGSNTNLVNKFMCGDNYDDRPNCFIEGEYDLNKVGTYKLTYVAEDSSGNKKTKNFTLKVVNKSNSSSSSSSSVKKVALKEFITKYKTENTMIGIDVSAWQDDINWEKAKKDGVEFAILRIGYGPSDGVIKEDKWFKNNIKKATAAGIPLGVYLYSYAKTEEDAVNSVKWIVEKLNGQKLDIGIAFDWENWNSFNKYNVSFHKLNNIARTFIKECENNGYKGWLYSSAYYLHNIWESFPDNTWLAYYTSNNDFSLPFTIWQASSKGKVSGISGAVDIDILYK